MYVRHVTESDIVEYAHVVILVLCLDVLIVTNKRTQIDNVRYNVTSSSVRGG